jgi:hypothetical protein
VLNFLSVDADNTHFGGNTRVDGTFTVTGSPSSYLTDVSLEVIQNGSIAAIANLSASGRKLLIGHKFGSDHTLSVGVDQFLFQLPNSQAAGIDISENGSVNLRVIATSSSGGHATANFNHSLQLLTIADLPRFGPRDEAVGGDDWVQPNVVPVLGHFASAYGVRFGDRSKMNGGPFPQHMAHQKGLSADGWFEGYDRKVGGHWVTTAAAAKEMIAMLNDVQEGARIGHVYVTMSPAFDKVVDDAGYLQDHRLASNVITELAHHDTHFHWEIIA